MKWYENKVVIILLLIFFFPVGAFLLWKFGDFGKNAKIILTVAFGIMFLFIIIASAGDAAESDDNDTTTSLPVQSTTQEQTTTMNEKTTIVEIDTTMATTKPIQTEAPTAKPAPTEAPTAKPTAPTTVAPATIKRISGLTDPVSPNEKVTFTIQGAPNTEYKIGVYYKSGASTADGLENKTSDSSGNVSWSWKIGGSTEPGTYRITVNGGGEEYKTEFTVK